MKDLGEASFVLGIKIHQDISKEVLVSSHKIYLEKFPEKYSMHVSKLMSAPIVKGDGFEKFQSPKNRY